MCRWRIETSSFEWSPWWKVSNGSATTLHLLHRRRLKISKHQTHSLKGSTNYWNGHRLAVHRYYILHTATARHKGTVADDKFIQPATMQTSVQTQRIQDVLDNAVSSGKMYVWNGFSSFQFHRLWCAFWCRRLYMSTMEARVTACGTDIPTSVLYVGMESPALLLLRKME